MSDDKLATRRAVIVARFPDLAHASITWEASLLAVVRPAVSLPVPALEFFDGPVPFSRHAKLEGSDLLSHHWGRIPDDRRQALAVDLARFYAEMHALDHDGMRAQGATSIEVWLPADEILRRTLPLLPDGLRRPAERTVREWHDLPPDPHGDAYGFFDGHGWNMAFDHDANRLRGVYDFADSGFGPVHQEFIYSNFISPDLTARIVGEYERFTGRRIDRRRVALLTGVHRLWELAAQADGAAQVPAMLAHVTTWARHAWADG